MTFLTIRIEGGLLSPDFLDTIHDQTGQKAVDFGLDARRSLVDEVTAVWSDVRTYWEAFERRQARARDGESLTTATREAWVIPLLEALGYRLTFQRRAAEVDGRSYAISHRATTGGEAGGRETAPQSTPPLPDSGPPVHIVAFDQKLGERPPSGRGTLSPHALVQDYLNRSDDLWGIVTNGATLRLLRDSAYFSRPSYIEFDLQGMLDGERLDEFILFYRLAHRSRLPAAGEDGGRALLETYHQAAVEQGGRIRDGLRKAVEEAILTLASGFLTHPKNGGLRQAVADVQLPATDYYQQLLYLIYRLLFLLVAEERNLVGSTEYGVGSREMETGTTPYSLLPTPYSLYYGITRLCRLAEEPLSGSQRFDDLYLGLRTLFDVLRDETQAPALGVAALNGELFDRDRTRYLEAAYLNNRDLLRAIRQLSHFTPADEQVPRRVNYAALDVEELGSVYESLLDEHPVISFAVGGGPQFAFVRGTERKTTGSYYTARELVKETLDSALDPVIAERLKAAAEGLRRAGAAIPRDNVRVAQIAILLAIRVCDSACGSGHFLLAAARRIARALAQADTGEDEPAPEALRHWTREAIIHSIYGVDKNPLAVDLCKVALWIEGHAPGKPLTFLDAHIKCGDSLVGVFDLKVLDEGIPDAAFDPVTGDDKAVARNLKQRNKREREGQLSLAFPEQQAVLDQAVRQWQTQLDSPEDTPAQVRQKRVAYNKLKDQESAQRTACDLWTAAFFMPLTAANVTANAIPTTGSLQQYRRQPATPDARLVGHAQALALRNQFFHWPLEFPHVFAGGGFTVMLGNPPWERIKLQEQEFFAARDAAIANAPNKAARQRLIEALPQSNPPLARELAEAKHGAEAGSKFVRASGRYPLTAVGDVNTYVLFAELARQLIDGFGRIGMICPPGVVSDDTTKTFFADLIDKCGLVSVISFLNEKAIFPQILHNFRFCVLTMAGPMCKVERADFVCECQTFDDIRQSERHFTLSREDLALLNPNTRTASMFHSRVDAELIKAVYRRVPVLVKESTGENPWGVRFMSMFHMSNDSHLFRTQEQLTASGYVLIGNHFKNNETWQPLYEGKMMHQFDHRYGSYKNSADGRVHMLPLVSVEQHQRADYGTLSFYFVSESQVEARLSGRWAKHWVVGFRDVTNKALERTAIFTILPRVGIGNKVPILLLDRLGERASLVACLLADCDSLTLDYITRQKLVSATMNFFIVKQLPILPPSAYTSIDIAFIGPRSLELVYTAWDMAPFAADVWKDSELEGYQDLRSIIQQQWEANRTATGGHPWNPPAWANLPPTPDARLPIPPFKWDENRRALLRAELDAYYARIYGLTRDELRYILDPKDVYGPDFPSETFRVLKEKEIKQFGEYRTRRLVLEAWDRLEAELGPVVVRNYREEMAQAPARIAEPRTVYLTATDKPAAQPPPSAPQPDLFGAVADATPTSKPVSPPKPPVPQPVLLSTPPQGTRTQRLNRLLEIGRKPTPAAIGELVAALGDEDEQLRWLATLSLQAMGGETVVATLDAFVTQAPSVLAREEAARLLEKLRAWDG